MRKRYTTDVELTPLIDVLFMLIVFFVLTTSFAASSISVDLPAGTGGQVEGSFSVITVTKQGEVLYEGKNLTPEEAAKTLAAKSGEQRILIRADGEAAYGKIIEVLDALGNVGLGHIDLAVEDNPVP
ncbi:MAG: ExbD/TolR family protein [Thermovirgaceae bacterium]